MPATFLPNPRPPSPNIHTAPYGLGGPARILAATGFIMHKNSTAPTRSDPTRATGWSGHLRATLLLALPLVGAQLAQMSMGVTDTVMIGWLGARELAASVLATQAFFLFYIFGVGFAQATLPVAAAAEGRGDVRGVRRSMRMGLWVLLGYSALAMIPLWHIETILRALDQDPEIARLAAQYMRVAQWSMPAALMVMGLRSYLTIVNRAWLVLAATVIGALCNGLLNWVFIFGNLGAPALGITGAAIATTLTNIVMALLLLAYSALAPALRRYTLYARFWRPDWPAFFEVLRLGWPIGATIIAEVGLFATSSVMMGWIGTIELAAHGIALQIASIAFMIPLGIASAATVRVGLAYGRGDPIDIGRAGMSALILGLAVAFGSASLFWLWPRGLISLYLDLSVPTAPWVLAAGAPLLIIAAAFQIFDSMQAVASGILRGFKDTRVPMLIAVFSYWIIGMPTAYLLAFPLGLGGPGIWTGLAVGLAAAALLLTTRFLRRDRLGLMRGAGIHSD